MVKFRFYLLFWGLLLTGCSSGSVRNPYLHPPSFRIQVDMNLPQYSALQYPGNAVYVDGGGIYGVFIYNNGYGYVAFEAADPNHSPDGCTAMRLSGLRAVCPCDQNTYSVMDGQLLEGNGTYPMLPYHVSQNGNLLYIYN
jgi:nitrite reductase/ring-hydroxylating ferredoxin subunit